MYKVIGTDGKQYGPATSDQVRQWIRENRVERQTPVLVQGSEDWTVAGLHPEFVHDFPDTGQPPIVAPPPFAHTQFCVPVRSSMANAALICGILSVTLCCCCGGLPFNFLGLVFSIIALVQIAENPQLYGGKAKAIIGLILSALGIFIMLLALIIK